MNEAQLSVLENTIGQEAWETKGADIVRDALAPEAALPAEDRAAKKQMVVELKWRRDRDINEWLNNMEVEDPTVAGFRDLVRSLPKNSEQRKQSSAESLYLLAEQFPEIKAIMSSYRDIVRYAMKGTYVPGPRDTSL